MSGQRGWKGYRIHTSANEWFPTSFPSSADKSASDTWSIYAGAYLCSGHAPTRWMNVETDVGGVLHDALPLHLRRHSKDFTFFQFPFLLHYKLYISQSYAPHSSKNGTQELDKGELYGKCICNPPHQPYQRMCLLKTSQLPYNWFEGPKSFKLLLCMSQWQPNRS